MPYGLACCSSTRRTKKSVYSKGAACSRSSIRVCSRREQSLAGTGGEGQGLGQEPHFSHSLSPVPGVQGHLSGS